MGKAKGIGKALKTIKSKTAATRNKGVQPNKVNPALAGTAAAGAAVGTGLTISARKNKTKPKGVGKALRGFGKGLR